ncbi:cold shock and DUF1294 domain-containing protein [Pseudacidovorax sp. RU35E]|uniref:DUF1294 domain-containing protein n=1 Tax=Pseudacidovorax sp. RU35E TaxID=1907403 RepID=UPI000956605C|nr:cold shock and DUF1294 domain-containing protein [Pseudacidovorax sp. RU35E]SIQ13346.1 Uncharacterized membrane protein YsdA, DUF1294 family [Pseudacidovorax sp. RU35E]
MSRFTGTVREWNDERGFGFIDADVGGEPIFFHIKALPPGAGRPQRGQRLSFEVGQGPNQRKRALHVRPERGVAVAAAGRRRAAPIRARRGGVTLFVLPAFGLVWLTAVMTGNAPRWTGWLYVGASAVCFAAYALDKSAARAGRWRTPESTLLMLGLLGGWPGAILAQQYLRHKSSKASFRKALWGTVVANVVGFLALAAGGHLGWSP